MRRPLLCIAIAMAMQTQSSAQSTGDFYELGDYGYFGKPAAKPTSPPAPADPSVSPPIEDTPTSDPADDARPAVPPPSAEPVAGEGGHARRVPEG